MAEPSYYYPYGRIQHYYGDHVRALFVALAILVALYVGFDWDVGIAVAVAAPTIVFLGVLAGLTSPKAKFVLLADAAVSIVGILLSQWQAVVSYGQEYYPSFATLECISVGFLLALYFSVKTIRAMNDQKIGQP